MWQHGVGRISHEHNFSASPNPLLQRLSVVQNPLRGLLIHTFNHLPHRLFEVFEIFRQLTSLSGRGPAFSQPTQLLFWR